MNETRSNSRTKPMKGGFKGEEINSLKDSEKTNEYKKDCYINIKIKPNITNALSQIKYQFLDEGPISYTELVNGLLETAIQTFYTNGKDYFKKDYQTFRIK